VRTSFSGRPSSQIAERRRGGSRRSRDRGRKGHRILRRVLVGGRHFGLSRAIVFHEKVVKAASAAPSHTERLTRARARKVERRKAKTEREGAPEPCGAGSCDRSVRGTIGFASAAGVKRPRPHPTHLENLGGSGVRGPMAACR